MLLAMPKVDKAPTHRGSFSAASVTGSGVRSSSWSTKDDETLIAARAQGLNWNQISPQHFPNKTPNACRKRHERLMERQNAEQWDGVKLDVLAQAYMEIRKEMWALLANRIGEKWTVVEQKCMEKGLKNLNQAYRSAQKKRGAYDGQHEGTYDSHHDDSGLGNSDLEDSVSPADDRRTEMPTISEATAQYPSGFVHHRVPSIQSMLAQYPSQYHHPQQQQTPPQQPPPQ